MSDNNDKVKEILKRLNINEEEVIMKIAESYTNNPDVQPKKIFHVVEYAGFFHIQTEDVYGGLDILNADHVGYENAKNFAERIAALLNKENSESLINPIFKPNKHYD